MGIFYQLYAFSEDDWMGTFNDRDLADETIERVKAIEPSAELVARVCHVMIFCLEKNYPSDFYHKEQDLFCDALMYTSDIQLTPIRIEPPKYNKDNIPSVEDLVDIWSKAKLEIEEKEWELNRQISIIKDELVELHNKKADLNRTLERVTGRMIWPNDHQFSSGKP